MSCNIVFTRVLRFIVIAVVVLSAGIVAVASAEEDGDGRPKAIAPADHARGLRLKSPERDTKRWAVIIGVNEYLDPKIPNLQYCVADARLMHDTLIEHCGYESDNVLLITDEQPKASQRPLKLVLSEAVERFLTFPNEGDTILVYFAGHGFLDDEGRGYLAPQDCNHKNLEQSALRTSELKKALHECKAAQKMLVLDCCHAGGERSENIGGTGEELGQEFDGAKGLLTLASCKKEEFSNEWQAKEQGLFTYYLAEALEGEADRDGDGIVDADEAYLYTWNQVRLRSLKELGTKQTPVRIIGEDVDGVFAVAWIGKPTKKPEEDSDKTDEDEQPLEDQPEAVYPIAILPFHERGGEVKGLGSAVSDLTFAHLSANPNLLLVDRQELQTILDEQELNLSGLVRPNEAIRLGQLTGAKLIVTGSVLQIDDRIFLVAKIISTETSRVVGASANGKSTDDLGSLVEKLAKQAGHTISQSSDKLVAKPLLREDRVAKINEAIGDAKRPTLWISIKEEHTGQQVADPAAETEAVWFATEADFPVVDAEVGSKKEAQILVTGEGISEYATRRGNLVSVRGRLEVKAVDANTGQVIAIDRQTTVAVGLSEQIAGKLALQDAATEISERLLPKLAN